MKRGAEKQLIKDDPDDDDIQEIQEPQGFQKADEASLAKRQIRALPKRALTASRPPSLNGTSPSLAPDVDKVEVAPPKFVGFGGFGAGNAASNSFTFAAQSPAVSSVFDSTSNFEKSALAVKAGPSNSFPGEINSFPVGLDTFSPQPTAPLPTEEKDTVAFKYFKSLRGLNVSFLSAISTAVEKDPFCDVASLVESYKNLRTTIQSEFDGSSKQTNSVPPFVPKTLPEKSSLFMPKPLTPTEASSKPPPISESGTKIGGFAFPPFAPPPSSTSTQLPFSLVSKRSEPSTSASTSTTPPEHAKSAFVFPAPGTSALTPSLPSTPGFSFATPSNVEDVTSKPISGPSDQKAGNSSTGSSPRPASAAPSVGSGSAPNFFGVKPTSPFGTSDPAPKPPSLFGSSAFGSSAVAESTKSFPLNLPPPDSIDSSKAALIFGSATSASSSTSASVFGSSDKPVSLFGSASQPKTSTFTFGKPGGSIGNPVGFGFGSTVPGASDTTLPGPSSSAFSFGASSTKPSESLFSPPITDRSSESTPQPEAEGNDEGMEDEAVKLLPSHAHDGEGEGEEDEDTTYAARCKVYRLSKSDDKGEWKDLGIGMLRLKKHKETHVRRVLMRNSNTGRILVNFRIYGNMKLSLTKTAISFIGYENSTPTSFSVRLKTEEQAGELKQAFDREIVAIQATE